MHLNLALDDDAHARAHAVKEVNGWTWEQSIVHATDSLKNDPDIESGTTDTDSDVSDVTDTDTIDGGR